MPSPERTAHVAGFNKWRDQFGRNVLKGEKGIRIIAPTPYKKKVEEIKTDPETNGAGCLMLPSRSLRKSRALALMRQ